jgi:hypothetical protein
LRACSGRQPLPTQWCVLDPWSTAARGFLAWLAKERLGIPTVYVNGGLHLTGVVPILPAMVRKTFRRIDAVALRDAWSLRNVQEYVPGLAAAALFPDAAFTLTPEDPHVSRSRRLPTGNNNTAGVR